MSRTFHDEFVELFQNHFHRLYRYLDRLTGQPDLAADLAQEAFIKLYQRGALPDAPGPWLVAVAMNLLRNAHAKRERQNRLLHVVPEAAMFSDRAVEQTDADAGVARKVRAALDQMPEREKQMLLLRAEGYSYKDIAGALELNEASVGKLLARARQTFRTHYER